MGRVILMPMIGHDRQEAGRLLLKIASLEDHYNPVIRHRRLIHHHHLNRYGLQ